MKVQRDCAGIWICCCHAPLDLFFWVCRCRPDDYLCCFSEHGFLHRVARWALLLPFAALRCVELVVVVVICYSIYISSISRRWPAEMKFRADEQTSERSEEREEKRKSRSTAARCYLCSSFPTNIFLYSSSRICHVIQAGILQFEKAACA